MANSKPHIVFLHGAWHSPLYFSKITSYLQDHFYVVHAQQLPAVGVPPLWTPPKDLTQDVAAAQSLVNYAIGDGNDVVVICHSWGGTVASSALVGYGKEERAKKGLKGGVVKVGYMSAFMIDEGVSLHEQAGGKFSSWCDEDGLYITMNDPDVMYGGLPQKEQAYWFAQLQTHSVATLKAPTLGASWKTIPSSYLVCEQDRAIPVKAQEMMIKAAQGKGASVEISRLNTGHSPYLTMPRETVAWIRSITGEQRSASL